MVAPPLHPIGWRWTLAICVACACLGAGCWTASAARTAAAPVVNVTAGKPSEFAFDANFDGERVRKDGRFVTPDLEGLNPERLTE